MTGNSPPVFVAIDIGASGGRVIAGWLADGRITSEILHRFPNGPIQTPTGLRWDLTGLHQQVIIGLTEVARRHPNVISIGIDTWAVDYGLLDAQGRLVEEPHSYREARTAEAVAAVHGRIPPEELYTITGLQFLPFNTIYQLVAEQSCPAWGTAAQVVLLPDLLAHQLTGRLATDVTNASTTALLHAGTRDWSDRLLEVAGLRRDLLPPIEPPGSVRGRITEAVAEQTGLSPDVVVTTVGTHDTASAVAAVPATGPNFGYVSSGTWSLVGIETPEPILTEASRLANFTNEAGVDGRIRYLRNEGGLWLLQESLRQWTVDGLDHDLGQLLDDAAKLPAGGPLVDVGAEEFIAPGDMPARIIRACVSAGGAVPRHPAGITRCVLDSLAAAYAKTVQEAAELSGRTVDRLHIVGGGSQNELLCRLTAEATGLPVIAGPVEATALGNLLVQARTHRMITGTLEDLRRIVAASSSLTTYQPAG
ncbi:rhamnulokinase family protein [Microlunatus sp. Gsoil 973]|uniref:rhamnulokinase n=1 Tax=Microlunatus sp. Gsoil 973 TaxID=2672569 RepID=UPI0012B49A55|nr:rhamnulokinase family protein [Microlunatus sp. Gsoil 973]QGN31607.1 rhamnulokinase [Microlunatus sp. Gsoil 973]